MTKAEKREVPKLLYSATEIDQLAQDLQGQPLIAVDTEMDSGYSYQGKVCLLQISIPGHDYLIDPLVADLSPLRPIFADPGTTAIFHAGENDIPHLRKEHNLHFAKIFDTYTASGILGYEVHGLAGLLNMHFGIELDKQYQRADWTIRPLPEAMASYATHDTHWLIDLRAKLNAELEEKGLQKDAEAAFAHIALTRMKENIFNPDNWTRMKGLRGLPRQLNGALRALYIWRETTACALNLNVSLLMPDYMVIKIAQAAPKNRAELDAVCNGSSRAPRIMRYAEEVLEVLEKGLAEGAIPYPKRPNANYLTREQSATLHRLKVWRQEYCQSLGLAPEQVITGRQLKEVVRCRPKNLAELVTLPSLGNLSDSRIRQFAPGILEALHNQAQPSPTKPSDRE